MTNSIELDKLGEKWGIIINQCLCKIAQLEAMNLALSEQLQKLMIENEKLKATLDNSHNQDN